MKFISLCIVIKSTGNKDHHKQGRSLPKFNVRNYGDGVNVFMQIVSIRGAFTNSVDPDETWRLIRVSAIYHAKNILGNGGQYKI